jgi:prepilin-type N-terminal cleavage/methylation domain-containing protein
MRVPSATRFPRPPRRSRRAFTVIEMMIVLLIMSIVSVLGMDTISEFEAGQRAQRASLEILAFFRYARTLAMTTGDNAEVQLDTTNNTFAVYLMSNGTSWDATPYAQSMASGGTMLINLNTERELAGTVMTVSPTTATAFIYQPLGTCTVTGTIRFTFGGKVSTLTVPAVGDPQVQ